MCQQRSTFRIQQRLSLWHRPRIEEIGNLPKLEIVDQQHLSGTARANNAFVPPLQAKPDVKVAQPSSQQIRLSCRRSADLELARPSKNLRFVPNGCGDAADDFWWKQVPRRKCVRAYLPKVGRCIVE